MVSTGRLMARALMVALVAAWAAGALAADEGDFVVVDEAEFRKILLAGAKVERLATGFKFTEGPVWVPDEGGYLVFSDIPANRLVKWTAREGSATFREDSRQANGNTLDLEGRLVTAEHAARRLTRTEKTGKVEVLVDRFEGKRFNSPNDVVVRAADGSIYFTDPDYGLPRGEERELAGNHVYRFDPKTRAVTVLVKDFDKPNGLAFSPDERRLYVADSGRPRHIRVFDLKEDGTLHLPGKVFCTIDTGVPDGIRVDADGRVWSSAGDGVHVFSRDGALVAKLRTPLIPDPDPRRQGAGRTIREGAANLCFGGEDGKTLFITARTSLYGIKTNVKGAGR